MSDAPGDGSDSIDSFLYQADKLTREARFIVDSLPNAEVFAVERAVRQLRAIHLVLINLDDEWLSPEDIEPLILSVTMTIAPLQHFLDSPHPPRNIGTTTLPSTSSGRPKYDLDMKEASRLHLLGNSWESVAEAMGVTRKTIYNHLAMAGMSSSRKEFTTISDEQLDERVSEISLKHPFAGSSIILGHLEGEGIHLPAERIQESVRRVDAMGVLIRWGNVIKRRVYRVRGSNALWHMDGNEKLRPWGFYVHGCVDGHSRLIIYLACVNNKRSSTVEAIYMAGVERYGWPSRGRGDFGKENNGAERRMIARWGVAHRAYLRGRSLQNIRIERLWRDVRKDTLEFFRQIFFHLEDIGLLDMESPIDRVCLYLVFQPRIQQSLDETVVSWNNHKIRTAGNKSPIAIYELSRQHAINRGYWTGDPGDDIETASNPLYGHDPSAPAPPADELLDDPTELEDDDSEADGTTEKDTEKEKSSGICVNEEEEIEVVRDVLKDWDLAVEDGNHGIDMYCQAVLAVTSYFTTNDSDF